MDDEPTKVEEGRRRNDVARLRVGQIRFDESDVLKERSDFRRVDGFLLYRQAVETKAERCFEDDIGGDLKHKNCFEVFLTKRNQEKLNFTETLTIHFTLIIFSD